MLTPFELDQRRNTQALKAQTQTQAQVPTPQHAAAASANEYADGIAEAAEAERQRSRIQHEVNPPPEVPEVAEADLAALGKRFSQAAYDVVPAGYPAPMGPVSPETFRRGTLTAGEAAVSPGYAPSARPVPIPSATISAAAVSRPLLTDGRSRPSAPAAGESA
jgi:hypothetical protein